LSPDPVRIPPLTEGEWTKEQRRLLEYAYRKGGFYNVIGTLARHWDASKALGQVGAHVLGPTSTLPPQHVQIGLKAGLTASEIQRVKRGPGDRSWAAFDVALLQAADELHAEQYITDATWRALREGYDSLQLMDVVFAVGQYTLIAMALKSFGTPLDEGLEGF
jgi:4-carboxymuconolactone decarboxylase